jgi:predicted ATPase
MEPSRALFRASRPAPRYARPVYLKSIDIDNVKLLRELHLDFVHADGSPRMWTVLIGENGRCKTSILRAIALAASGAARGNELGDLASLVDKRGERAAHLHAIFTLPLEPRREHPKRRAGAPAPSLLSSDLTIPPGMTSMLGESKYLDDGNDNDDARGDALFEVRGRNLPHWFVAGYGTNRVLPRPGAVEPVSNASSARLLSLFDRGAIVGTGFADLLEDPKVFARLLRDVLIHGELLPKDALDIELRGRGGIRSGQDLVEGSRFRMRSGEGEVAIPATWLSQGYQSTIAWIADFLGHVLLEAGPSTEIDAKEICGLVLIDEIDLHLHPRWQARLVTALKAAFPKVQFVVTTHSPMVLPSLTAEEVVLLDLDEEGSVVARSSEVSPMLLTGSELYRDFFGISELEPRDIAEDHRRYAFLVGNPARTDAEDAEMSALRTKLQRLGLDPGWEPVARSPS